MFDVEQKIGRMKNRKTVKVTYWSLAFFCNELDLFGVDRGLGYPSGGLCGWLDAISAFSYTV